MGARRRRVSFALGGIVALLPIVPMVCEHPVSGGTQYPLRHDYSLSPGFEEGTVTSCYFAEGEGRVAMCRTLQGYEDDGVNDQRYWTVYGPLPGRQNPDRILAQRGADNSYYGRTRVVDDGYQYEGCDWHSPDDTYTCDYRSWRHVAMQRQFTSDFVLRKMWDWSLYTGNLIGCASGITAVWYGNVFTVGALAGCLDGPL